MKCGIFFIVYFLLGNLSSSLGGEATDLMKLQESSLSNLLNSTLINTNILDEARIIYKWKFGHMLVDISYVSKNKNEIFISNDVISIGPELAGNFLKIFGREISKLIVSFEFIHTKQKEIGKLVNQYCSETLIEFHARHCKDGAFDEMKKPFAKVERVVFIGIWNEITDESCGLDYLFPEMRVLYMSITDSYILDRHYPHLTELNADVDVSSRFIKFFEKNKQIKSLRLGAKTSMELIKTINEELSDLEFLEFRVPDDMSSYTGPEIQMKHVQNVTIRGTMVDFQPDKISFKKLDHLKLSIFAHLEDKWINLITANKKLKSLTMNIWNLNNTALLKLTDKLHSLVEVELNVDLNIEIDNIAKFLESNKNMKTVVLHFPRGSVLFLEKLAVKLKETWEITPTNKFFNVLKLTKLPEKNSASTVVSSVILISLIVTKSIIF